MKIDPAAWPELSRLLDEWLDLAPEAREDWLARLNSEHAELAPVLQELAVGGDQLFATLPKLAGQTEASPGGLAVGALIGPYRLIRELGRGGMAVVWLAERADGTLQRTVALKLPSVVQDNQTLAARFVRERNILSGLTHPNIARLYDAGVSAEGRPYLALEFVEGEPIGAYCDRLHLGLPKRLTLLLHVLRAVQYAHTNLIVHRDLKPSNILVTGEGEVRLLDFGIAKLLTEDDSTQAALTRGGAQPLTPEYASPEQVAGVAVTAASDIYSLGVLMYELMTGARPYRLKRNTRHDLEEAILDAEVLPPSQAMAAGRPARMLRGDLDTIALEALQKQPERRYASADAFAQDIERYLRGEAVLARRQTAWYRARKFVGRNRLGVCAAAAVVAALSVGLEVAVVAKRHAQAEAATSKALSDFLQNDLLAQASARTQSNPNTRPNPDLKVRDALDRAAAQLSGKFDAQPVVEASIRQTIGDTYRDLGLYDKAEAQMERATALRRLVLGPQHLDSLTSMDQLSMIYLAEGKYAAAEKLMTEVLASRRRIQGKDHPATLATMNDTAIVMTRQGKYAQAAIMMEGILEAQQRILGDENWDTIVVRHNLATTYISVGNWARAEELYQKAAELKRRKVGAEHPSTLASLNGLGQVYRHEGKVAKAESTLTEVLEARRRVLGGQHPDTLDSLSSLALVYQAEERYRDSEPILLEVLATRRKVLGAEHSTTLVSISNLAELYRREGKRELAGPLLAQVLEARLRVLGPEHPATLLAMAMLGRIRLEEGRPGEAERLLRGAVSGYEKTGANSWQRYHAACMLGESVAEQGRMGEASGLLSAGYADLLQRQGSISADAGAVVEQAREWAARVSGGPK